MRPTMKISTKPTRPRKESNNMAHKNPLGLSDEMVAQFEPKPNELQNVVNYINDKNKPAAPTQPSDEETLKRKQALKEQILKVRDTGLTNMFHADNVSKIAQSAGLQELADYIANNRNAYIQFILHGGPDDLPNF